MSHTLTRILILATLLSACASSQKQPNEAALHLQIGTGYFIQGNYSQALRELLIAEKLDPKNEITENNLGLVYFLREKNELAEAHLAKAHTLNPHYTEALNNLARVHIEMGKYDLAVAELKRVLADLTYSGAEKAWVNFGLACFRKGDYRAAKEKLAEALRINRKNCLAYDLYGRSQFELGEYETAANSLDNAILLCKESQFDEPNYFSGLAYQKIGNSAKAVARMEEVIKLYPLGKYSQKAHAMLNLMTK